MAEATKTQLPGDTPRKLSPTMEKAKLTRAVTQRKIDDLSDNDKHALRIFRTARASLDRLIDNLIDGKDVNEEAVKAAASIQAYSI